MKLIELFPEISLNPASAKDIKQWILQLAVEGKLTKKWREENHISRETWGIKKLTDISDINGGYAFKSQQYTEQGIRVIRISDFDEHGLKNEKIVRHPYNITFEAYRLKPNNIIMAMTGGTVGKALLIQEVQEDMFVNQRVANIKITNSCLPNYVFSVLKAKDVQSVIEEAKNSTNDNISMNDIKNFNIPIPPLEEQHAIVSIVESLFKEVDELEAQATQLIALKRSYAQAALQRLCEADTAKEWQQIVSVFPEIFNDKQTIKTLRETILQLAVQGKLTAKWRSKEGEISSLEGGSKEGDKQTAHELLAQIKAEKAQLIKDKKIKAEKPLPPIEADDLPAGKAGIPFELPEGWVWCRLGEVGITQTGYTPSKDNPNYFGDFIPFLGPADISNNSMSYPIEGLSKLGLAKGRLIPKNSLMMVCIGGSIGKCNVNEIEVSCNQQINVISPILLQVDFLKHVAQAAFFQKSIILNSSGSATPIINKGKWELLLFPLAPAIEQQIIVEKVNALMGLCDELEKEVEGKENILQKI
jgi:type I restriction enzyme S subunit